MVPIFEELDNWEVITGYHLNMTSVPQLLQSLCVCACVCVCVWCVYVCTCVYVCVCACVYWYVCTSLTDSAYHLDNCVNHTVCVFQ